MSTAEKPLFIPVMTEYFDEFRYGDKNVEYRNYGPGWNERTCRIGRRVVVSKGYGKYERMYGEIAGFHKQRVPGLKSQALIWILFDAYQPDLKKEQE